MNDTLQNFLFGGTAGIVSRTVTSPFERLKILRQIFPKKYNNLNIVKSFIDMYKYEGIKGFFKGNWTNCIRVFPQQAVNFGTFNYINKQLNNKLDKKLNYFISGGISGTISYLFIYPLETIRSKLSVQTLKTEYNGVYDCFKKSVKTSGWRSLYRGSLLASMGMLPFQGTNFLTYNYLKDNYSYNNSPLNSLVFGSLSGIVSVTTTYPCDTIKRHLQLSGENGNPQYKGIIHCTKHIIKRQGIVGLYRGLVPCYTKIFPANGLYFLIIELLRNNL